MSAAAVSRLAHLSVNQVRNVQRGLHRPSTRVLAAIADALRLTPDVQADLRRLAGIDPDPGATAGARKARREAWPALVYVLVNHVLLPRLEFAAHLADHRRLPAPDHELLAVAAVAPDLISFVRRATDLPAPGAKLRRLLEETFRDAPPDAVADLQEGLCWALRAGTFPSREVPLVHRYRWDERWCIARTLLRFNRPAQPEYALYEYVHSAQFDYSFAVAYFPAVFWHACHVWPFDKLFNPYARACDGIQRRLYEEVRAGLSLDGTAAALVGRSALGVELGLALPSRPSPEEEVPGELAGLRRVPQPGGERVEITLPVNGGTVKFTGSRPPVDLLFDHLDRCALLERFPLIKIDRESFTGLGRSLNHPAWTAWTEHLAHDWQLPADAPPLSRQRFDSILCQCRSWSPQEDRPETLDSLLCRHVTEEAAFAMARMLGRGDWPAAARAAEALALSPEWLRIVRAIAAQRPTDEAGPGVDRPPSEPLSNGA